jgi:hypothetical protein
MNCRFYDDSEGLERGDDKTGFCPQGYCKAQPPDNRRKSPWSIVDCSDLCGGHVYDLTKVMELDAAWICRTALSNTLLKCAKSDCPVCGPNSLAVAGTADVVAPHAPGPSKENDTQRAFRAACEAVAQATGHVDALPIGTVRDAFKARHHVDEADPKKANKKRLDAWAWALKDLPSGFEVDRAGKVIRCPSEMPFARAA